MNFSFSAMVRRTSLIAALVVTSVLSSSSQADVIFIDLSQVNPAFHSYFQRAEAFWESRIQNYSTELPGALLYTLPKLRFVARTPFIDGPGGILGGASTKYIMQYQTPAGTTFRPVQKAMPVSVLIQIDSGDFPTNADEERMFFETIVHEIGHGLGIGSLWARNGLTAPLEGVGLTQYTGGKYALPTYRREANLPFAMYIPINQFGGAGSALVHWDETNPSFFNQTFSGEFKKELMCAFACDVTPSGDLVCAPAFTSETTWASLADSGWEVAGINDNAVDPPAAGTLSSRWPKISGLIEGPFAGTQVDINPGLADFRLDNLELAPGVTLQKTDITVVFKSSKPAGNVTGGADPRSNSKIDPYGLRNQRWVK